MRRFPLARQALATAAIAACSLSAHAGLVSVATDSFGYSNGALAGQAGGSGWTSAWASRGGAPTVDGSALLFTNNNANAAYRSVATTSGDIVVQFTLTVSGSPQNNDFLGLWFDNESTSDHTDVPNIGLKGNCGTGCGSGLDIFARTTGTEGSFTTPIVANVEYTVFGLLQKTGSASSYNRFSVWVNPTSDEMQSFTGADAVATGLSGLTSFNTIGFRTANLSDNLTVRIDNLSVSAVPEPASVLLAGLGLLAAGAASRRRRSA